MIFKAINFSKLHFIVDNNVENIIKGIGYIESKNRFINNTKGSSAKGKYQIINNTFRRVVNYYSDIITDKNFFEKHNQSNDDSVMLLLLNYYREKIKYKDLDLGACYLAHFLGAERADKMLSHQEDLVINYMTDNEIKWNKDVFKRFKLQEDCSIEEFIKGIKEFI